MVAPLYTPLYEATTVSQTLLLFSEKIIITKDARKASSDTGSDIEDF